MIVVKLSGGLGNQLFQYSLGRYLSLKYNTELKFDVQFDANSLNFSARSLGLSKFNITLNIASKEEILKYKFFRTGYLSRIERKLIQFFPSINKKIFVEKPFEIFNKELFTRDCYVLGYWQSEYYFRSIENVIRNDLQINFELGDVNKDIFNEISNSESVSIHIRRGDYITINGNSKIYSLCSLEYYNDAIAFLKSKFGSSVFYIFSDDIAWAKEIFLGDIFKIIDNNLENPHVDLFLMSLCKHNIIANSSFSWWAAWLNCNKNKVIVSPREWYVDKSLNKKAISSLILENWVLI